MKIDIDKIIAIVRKTRDLSLPYFGKIEAKNFKSESFTDAVTEIDEKIENFLRTNLNEIIPEVSFVGEEFGGERSAETFWLVDPIDGTGNYIRGIPYCTTMLALINRGEVVFSIIYDFVNDVIYHAQKGVGAFKNGNKIQISNRHLGKSYLVCEINSKKDTSRPILNILDEKTSLIHHNAAGYDFVLVAEGKIEGRIMYDPFGKDFDFAPGALLVSEAGGIVRNFKSNSYDYKNLNFYAGNKEVYESLIVGEDGLEKMML